MATECKPSNFLYEHLESLKVQNLHRHLRPIESAQDTWVNLEGRRVLNLCSNNYLGLASHPQVREAAAQGAKRWGCGSGASRLICGSFAYHRSLENRLAAFKGTEAALLFGSGYTANLGIISALVGRGDHVFSDELNHASIIDGCRLSQAQITVFPHNDLMALEDRLRQIPTSGKSGRKLIVVDSVFSMDGDIAPLPDLANLAERYECLLMIDEAHATGVLGPGGRGLLAQYGIQKKALVSMSTLSKALGSFGGFAAGSQQLIEFLLNTSRSFIFTTALPASVVAASTEALSILETNPSLSLKVMENAQYLRDGLRKLGFDTLNSETQIIPVIIGDAARTVETSRLLFDEGVLATAIRPPTVAEGTCRMRTTVMATHTRQDLDFALAAFKKVGRQMGII